MRKRDIQRALKRAYKLLKGKGWTKGSWARDVSRFGVDPKNQYAVCWCSAGAIRAATKDCNVENACAKELIQALPKKYSKYIDPIGAIIHWNDEEKRTRKNVLTAFEKTIVRLGGKV